MIENSIIWANASYEGSGFYIYANSSPISAYCDIQDTLWPGEGNISIDPRFRDPDNGDFHLMSTACGDRYDSPCIDAGDPSIFDYLLDCDWGLGGQRSDMGAYGGQAIPTDIREEHPPTIPMACGLFQNYPNPFNASTTLSYMLAQSGPVTISIYNILGQQVCTLVEGHQLAGTHSISWQPQNLSSGLYFARLKAGKQSSSVVMMLLE